MMLNTTESSTTESRQRGMEPIKC